MKIVKATARPSRSNLTADIPTFLTILKSTCYYQSTKMTQSAGKHKRARGVQARRLLYHQNINNLQKARAGVRGYTPSYWSCGVSLPCQNPGPQSLARTTK